MKDREMLRPIKIIILLRQEECMYGSTWGMALHKRQNLSPTLGYGTTATHRTAKILSPHYMRIDIGDDIISKEKLWDH